MGGAREARTPILVLGAHLFARFELFLVPFEQFSLRFELFTVSWG